MKTFVVYTYRDAFLYDAVDEKHAADLHNLHPDNKGKVRYVRPEEPGGYCDLCERFDRLSEFDDLFICSTCWQNRHGYVDNE